MKTHQYIPPLARGALTLGLLGLCLLTACTSGNPNSTQTLIPMPTPTQTPQSIYELATNKSPFLANSLSNNSSALYPWREGTDKIGTCIFTGGAYHNIEPTPGDNFHACSPPGVTLRDFVFQVQMTIVKGDAGGIIFRLNSNFQHYMFLINEDGSYELRVDFAIIAGGSSSAIKVGLHRSNLIAIVAQGNTFDLFVNKHYITSVNDSALSAGGIGTVAHAINKPTEVEFRNAMVWTL
jgi:eukaryotic-like serine/threonine-protein kinase